MKAVKRNVCKILGGNGKWEKKHVDGVCVRGRLCYEYGLESCGAH